ncbi:MAG: hypothetical protein CVV64_12385 [Candidatus Wallbacteria bacterium HGW-Wallbacteria-1]|jgi:signal transduction histidine kinase|uniref:histidine kinase n=1 Tax=Candidatus Wallbacteria bacterium HGW-Wallbacteria-1 TaxID=2013854 RepID=A0A2N1PNA2_9BACT|nr:MAG: hypothetical protein CVV64_12385 [Candidatus Wallbacteria bacterium HGW-Wallbacteria-1]
MRLIRKASSINLIQQLVLCLVTVAVIPLLVISYQSLHCSTQAVHDLQAHSLKSQLDAREKLIGNWLEERRRDLQSLQNSSCLDSCQCNDSEASCGLFNMIGSREHTYDALFLYDVNWKLIQQQSNYSHSGVEILDSQQKKLLMTTDGLLFSSAHGHEDGSISIHASCRIVDKGVTRGYAFAVLNATQAIAPIIQDSGSPFRLRLISSQGQNILMPADKKLFRSLPESVRRASGELQTYISSEGVMVVGVSKKLEDLEWIMIIEASEAITMQWIGVLGRRNLYTAGLTLLAAFVIAVFLSRSITLPFNRLNSTAREISLGNTSVRMPLEGVTESRELAMAFNDMMDSLSQLHIKVSQQKALAEIGQLTSSVVHEMRNPLSSIRLNVQAISGKVADDPVYSELAEICVEQADRLEHLLNELLLYGKPLDLNRQRFACSELFSLIQRDCNVIVSGSNVRIEFEISSELPDIYVDPEKMRQVFINLVENAVQAIRKTGTILIEAIMEGEMIRIVVRDDGPGIPDFIASQLFRPFVSGRSDGTGLGLANVRRFVELNGGSVAYGSRAGGGAEFTIHLPAENRTIL